MEAVAAGYQNGALFGHGHFVFDLKAREPAFLLTAYIGIVPTLEQLDELSSQFGLDLSVMQANDRLVVVAPIVHTARFSEVSSIHSAILNLAFVASYVCKDCNAVYTNPRAAGRCCDGFVIFPSTDLPVVSVKAFYSAERAQPQFHYGAQDGHWYIGEHGRADGVEEAMYFLPPAVSAMLTHLVADQNARIERVRQEARLEALAELKRFWKIEE